MTEAESEPIRRLAARAGLGPITTISSLSGGANNRVFRLETGASAVLLKQYFRHAHDPRNRLDTEYAFTRFAWERGVATVPRPGGASEECGLAWYEFIQGRRVQPGEVGDDAVAQALAFFHALNRHQGHADAQRLPDASESSATFAGHVSLVARRVSLLGAIEPARSIDRAAADFVQGELLPTWKRLEERLSSANRPDIETECCLSPSDFGFHNALQEPGGRLRFFDFEYAGWDDPARIVCDFFCQPAVPVPVGYFDRFAQSVASLFPDPERVQERAKALFPVYRVKWCCIVLNDFLPVGEHRRRFSGVGGEEDERKRAQLQKAQVMLRLAAA